MKFNMYGDWRDYMREALGERVAWYDPRTDTKQGAIAHFTSQDLAGVEASDVLFCFMSGHTDAGAAMECAHANAHGKLVVLCFDRQHSLPHPFLLGISRRVFIGIETGAAYLTLLVKHGLDNEFAAINAMCNL
jgi:hypothetical protein